MEIAEINKLLSNLQHPDPKLLKKVKLKKGHTGIPDEYGEGNQGEYNEYDVIYKILSEKDLFLKVTYTTDSYASNDAVTGVQIVKAKEKKVTVYEYE